MKEEDWTKQLYDKLADYEEPAPADLWADIEARLNQEPARRQSARAIPLWGKWAAAASFIGLLFGSGYYMLTSDSERPQADGGSVEIAKSDFPMKSQKKDQPQKPEETVPVIKEIKKISVVQGEALTIAEPVTAQDSPGDSALPQTSTESKTEQQPAETGRHPETTLPEKREAETIIRELDQKIAEVKSQKRSRTSFGLFASNDMGSWTNRNGVLMSPDQLANYDYTIEKTSTRFGDKVYLYNYEERQKHNQPISFGLTAKIPISSRISLSSGIVYTRLRSDFTNIANGYSLEKQQTLYYLGIPLSAQYQLWGFKGLNVYATAGGQVDFCIKTKVVSNGTNIPYDKDRPQFSMQGALGLQYDIIPQLGIYAEPGVKYYFHNGSKVRNFFKDKPTNFNLQLGLRLNL